MCTSNNAEHLTLPLENYIDGTALLALPGDFEEFQHLVPQSGLRMRLKAAIDKLCSSSMPTPNLCKVSEFVV